ncbi:MULTISPECIES: c-type cytochrome [unclassified Xanthobacter]|uniref:c-type cytochrome n=1 Tax=unclassified Xanthobacter TaxID=2623496 RepID=UPI001EDF5113
MSSSPLRSIRAPQARAGRLACALALGLVLSGGVAAHAAEPADAAAGQALANRWCASCHVVDANQKTAQSDAPSFTAIAAGNAELSAPWLAFRLLSPHPQMPQVSLSRAEARDLAAYFESLKK